MRRSVWTWVAIVLFSKEYCRCHISIQSDDISGTRTIPKTATPFLEGPWSPEIFFYTFLAAKRYLYVCKNIANLKRWSDPDETQLDSEVLGDIVHYADAADRSSGDIVENDKRLGACVLCLLT